NGKAYELYQSLGILAAVNGLAALVVDPIDQGERLQHIDANGKPYAIGTAAHNLVGVGAMLVGRNAATLEMWDDMRAIDYLQSRDDVLSDKIGVCGTSGGGTQTAYLMSLDDRVALAAPSCYICSLFGDLPRNLGPQDAEQNIFGQISAGMDHPDYLTMRAPIPTYMCCALQDFFNSVDGRRSFDYAKRLFKTLGAEDRIDIVTVDQGHGYAEEFRCGTVRWALRWLAGRDVDVVEHDQPLLTDEEIASIKSNNVVADLPGFRSSHDLNRDLARELTAPRKAKWENIAAQTASELVRNRAIIRSGNAAPIAKIVVSEENDVVFETDKNVFLTAKTNFNDDEKFDALTLRIGDAGRNSEATKAAFAAENSGKIVAVELRGYGETQATGRDYYNYDYFGTDGSDYCLAYLLGK
ncbi:MAG: hypothetical protein HUK22_07755, partial [Thermoguttaceae bacterium]|nr:hypothetical protein [Thermoguttaceae bacterium]